MSDLPFEIVSHWPAFAAGVVVSWTTVLIFCLAFGAVGPKRSAKRRRRKYRPMRDHAHAWQNFRP